jgi:hypothetical protein
MRIGISVWALVAVLVWGAPTEAAPVLNLLPPGGSVSAAPGQTVGWGYEVVNDDPGQWLVISSLNVPSGFQFGVGSDLIFSYPILAPLSSFAVPYIAGVQGLYEFTWDPAAPVGFVNNGSFLIGAELWDGDPFAGGQPVQMLPEFSLAYDVSVAPPPTSVPEPSTLFLMSSGIAGVAWLRRRRSASVTRG